MKSFGEIIVYNIHRSSIISSLSIRSLRAVISIEAMEDERTKSKLSSSAYFFSISYFSFSPSFNSLLQQASACRLSRFRIAPLPLSPLSRWFLRRNFNYYTVGVLINSRWGRGCGKPAVPHD